MLLEKEEEGVAPHFEKPLKPQVTEQDKPALLECVVLGTPTPLVKWYQNEREIKSDKGHKIIHNPETGYASLEILKPKLEDETLYTVKADNKFGRAQCRSNIILSKSVSISQPTIMQAPKITKPLKALIAKPDEDVVLEVQYEGIPKPEISWIKEGKVIKPTEDVKVITTENKTSLHISKTSSQKTGKYEVHAKNPKGEARSSGSVTVTTDKEMLEALAPYFVQPIKSQIVTPGETVIMEAVVEAQPTASFQWYQGSTPIISSTDVRLTTVDNRSILLINHVTAEEAITITCRAENAIGSVTSTATIEIIQEEDWEHSTELEYPRFVRRLSPVVVMDGEKVTFTCQVTGKPIPKVQWFFNNQPVKEAKDITICQDSEGLCMLAISEVFPENAGEYTCHAENKIGEAICKTTLVVDGK